MTLLTSPQLPDCCAISAARLRHAEREKACAHLERPAAVVVLHPVGVEHLYLPIVAHYVQLHMDLSVGCQLHHTSIIFIVTALQQEESAPSDA